MRQSVSGFATTVFSPVMWLYERCKNYVLPSRDTVSAGEVTGLLPPVAAVAPAPPAPLAPAPASVTVPAQAVEPINYATCTLSVLVEKFDAKELALSEVPLSRVDFFCSVFQTAVLTNDQALLTELLQPGRRFDAIKQKLYEFAVRQPRPARYGYIDVLRKANWGVNLSQIHLNRQIAALCELNGDPKRAQEIRTAGGHCHGWTFTEFFNTFKNQPGVKSFYRWWDAAKYELSVWSVPRDAKGNIDKVAAEAYLRESILLPDAEGGKPITRRVLFERMAQMVLAYQGYQLPEVRVSQAELTRPGHHKRDSSFLGITGQLPGLREQTFLATKCNVFSALSDQELEALITNPVFVGLASDGLVTISNHKHIIYLSMYQDARGEMRYQLYDSNFVNGRLSSENPAEIARAITAVLGSGIAMDGYGLSSSRQPSDPTATDKLLRVMSGVVTSPVTVEVLRNFVFVETDVASSHLAYFAEQYRPVVNQVFDVRYNPKNEDYHGTLVSHLIKQEKISLLQQVLDKLLPDLNVADQNKVTPLRQAVNAKNKEAVYLLLGYVDSDQINQVILSMEPATFLSYLAFAIEVKPEHIEKAYDLIRRIFPQLDTKAIIKRRFQEPQFLPTVYRAMGAKAVQDLFRGLSQQIKDLSWLKIIYTGCGEAALKDVIRGSGIKKPDLGAFKAAQKDAAFVTALGNVMTELAKEARAAKEAAAQQAPTTPRRPGENTRGVGNTPPRRGAAGGLFGATASKAAGLRHRDVGEHRAQTLGRK